MVEWATLIKAAQLIDSWCNGDKIPLSKWICKDDEKYIGIDNTDGQCWVEEFDTALECIKWLAGYEDRQETAEATVRTAEAERFWEALVAAFSPAIKGAESEDK